MKTKHTVFSLSVLVFVLLSAFSFSQAGDYSTLDVIGFSKDGKFMAFEEYGTRDGSGFPFVNIYFINVEKNAYASEPYKLVIEKENATETSARNKAKLDTAKKLQALKIVRGNSGKHLVSRLLTDLSIDKETNGTAPEELSFAEEINSNYRRGNYTLKIIPSEVKSNDCEVYAVMNLKFELTLLNNETKKTTTLQKDYDLPKSRGCAIRYRVHDVFLYEKNLAVFISVYTPGFEGEDMRYMVVTGKLD